MPPAVSPEQLEVACGSQEDSIVRRQADPSLQGVHRMQAGSLDVRAGSFDSPEARRWIGNAVQRSLERTAAVSRGGHRSAGRPELPTGLPEGMSAEQRCTATRLPLDLIVRVLGFVDDDQDLANALTTCRAWHLATHDVSMWQARMALLRPPAVGAASDGGDAAGAATDDPKRGYQRASQGCASTAGGWVCMRRGCGCRNLRPCQPALLCGFATTAGRAIDIRHHSSGS